MYTNPLSRALMRDSGPPGHGGHVVFLCPERGSFCSDAILHFDLVIGADVQNQGGMILANTENAIDKADNLTSELCVVRPELRSRGCAVRVTDGDSNELYRTPVELIPPWLKSPRH